MKLATLCYIKKNGQTLMIYRNKRKRDIHDGKWNGLGGKLHLGETPEECAIREVKEESGLAIKNPSLRGILTFPAFKDEEDWYVYVFVAHEFSGELVAESEEGDLKWIEDEKLLDLPLWEGDPIFLKWIDEGRFFSGKFVYENGRFVRYDVIFHDLTTCLPRPTGARTHRVSRAR
ncbi:MAG: 8-oxo-dGTP diphosphatase [Candidatus Omnitrophica bacterium]|nr:8-oxo-dGTP diphosphatase [Candidatus Omnitrophota bacterium]